MSDMNFLLATHFLSPLIVILSGDWWSLILKQ